MNMKSGVVALLALIAMTAGAVTEVTFYATNIVRVTKTEGRPLVQPIDVVRLKPAADAAERSPL